MGIFSGPRLEIKTPEQIRLMRAAGLVVASALDEVVHAAVAGATPVQLDALATRVIEGHGARPSFREVPGYRHTLCVSVNEQVVHGIPGEIPFVDGDVVSIDCGAVLQGWHGDAAVTVLVGGAAAARPQDVTLSAATEASLWAGIAAFQERARLNDVGGAVEDTIEAWAGEHGLTLGIVDGYTGHGIGTAMHMDPDVYNYRVKGRTPQVPVGATVAIEPMVTLGSADTKVLADEWTIVTVDGSRAAHWEHTVALTPDGPWVLTAQDGGAAQLAELGVTCGAFD